MCRFVCLAYYKSVFTVLFVFSPCKVVTLFARKRKFILHTFRDRIYHTSFEANSKSQQQEDKTNGFIRLIDKNLSFTFRIDSIRIVSWSCTNEANFCQISFNLIVFFLVTWTFLLLQWKRIHSETVDFRLFSFYRINQIRRLKKQEKKCLTPKYSVNYSKWFQLHDKVTAYMIVEN